MHRRVFHNGLSRYFLVVAMSLAFSLAAPRYGEAPEGPKNVDVTTKDLRELVDLLENPERREVFVKDLKNLIQLRQATTKEAEKVAKPPERKERRVFAIEKAFMSVESLFKGVLDAASRTATLVTRTPGALGKAKSFLSEPENRSKLLRLFGDIAGGIVIALVVGLLTRRYAPPRDERERSLPSRLGRGFITLLLSLAPYAALLVSLVILFQVFPSFPFGHTLALLIFLVVFFYRLALGVFSVLLAPVFSSYAIYPTSGQTQTYSHFNVGAGKRCVKNFKEKCGLSSLIASCLSSYPLQACSLYRRFQDSR